MIHDNTVYFDDALERLQFMYKAREVGFCVEWEGSVQALEADMLVNHLGGSNPLYLTAVTPAALLWLQLNWEELA